MAEDDDASASAKPAPLDPLLLGAAAPEDLRAYLREQTRLAALQSANLIEQNEFELSHLRFRRLSDWAKFGFEAAAALAVLAVVLALVIAVWSAAHADGLVIEAFSVPPDFASRGLTGQAVAAQLVDKLAALQNATDTARPADSYANNWGDDIKVQIPETGISIGDFYRLLVRWFGHETHITGEVWRTASGLAAAVRVNGQGGASVTGTDADVDGLLGRAAGRIFAATQPYRYSNWLQQRSRLPQSRAVLDRLSAEGATPRERAWAFLAIGVFDTYTFQFPDGIEGEHKALAIAPDFALAYANLEGFEYSWGRDGDALADTQRAVRLFSGRKVDMAERALRIQAPFERANLALFQCDFAAALAGYKAVATLPDYSGLVAAAQLDALTTAVALHDGAARREAEAHQPALDTPFNRNQHEQIRIQVAVADGNWQDAVAAWGPVQQTALETIAPAGGTRAQAWAFDARQPAPLVAYAMARLGDTKGAQALIDRTPLDCYPCLRFRARIAADEGRVVAADGWFARATAFAPDVPLAWFDWGRALAAKGDLDGAIAKLAIANAKGPHFADPYELWGEILLHQNRADLAVMKFAEAARCAPNWGRLHLKWGEALLWSGDRAGAAREFAHAASLDLSASDRIALHKVSHV